MIMITFIVYAAFLAWRLLSWYVPIPDYLPRDSRRGEEKK